ncbi:MAG: hypothetical protein PHC51_00690 [bacterium]|nr:hypothetical protein [bacterium]
MVGSTIAYGNFSRARKTTSTRLYCRLMLCLSLIFLSACAEQELTVRLTERQSISLLVSLADQGIDARRQYDDLSGTYDIYVPESSYREAMSVLDSSWPKPEFEGQIDNLLKDESFFPGFSQNRPGKDEKLLSLQVERLLSAVPGVEEVKALVRFPAADGPLKLRRIASDNPIRLAVVVKSTVGNDKVEGLRERLQKLLQGFFESENDHGPKTLVQIFMVESGRTSSVGERALSIGSVWPFSFRVLEGDRGIMSWQFTVFGLGLVIPAFVVGFVLGQRGYLKPLSTDPSGKDDNQR